MQLGLVGRRAARLGDCTSRRRPVKRRQLAFDGLEDRRLLAVNALGPQAISVAGAASPALSLNPGDVQIAGSRATAMDGNGDAVVVWADSQTKGSDGLPASPWSLHFQLYTNSGGTLTPGAGGPLVRTDGSPIETTVFDGLVAENAAPKVAMAPSGGFVVAWNQEPTSSQTFSTFAQLYNADGTPRTDPFLVGADGKAALEGVAMTDNGFDVLYGSPLKSSSNTNYRTITVQRYSSDGAAEGRPINVATPNFVNSFESISMDPSGNFVVGWGDGTSTGRWSSNWVYSVYAQRYSSAGKAVGSVIQLSASAFPRSGGTVAIDSSGDFVLAWKQDDQGLLAQTVYANNSVGTQHVVDPPSIGDMTPSIAMQSNGNYALSWPHEIVDPSTTPTTHINSVYAGTFLLSGAPQQSPFVVQSFTYQAANLVQYASAAVDEAGDLLVVYSGYSYANNPDGTYRVYTDGGLFGDFYLDPPLISTPSNATVPASTSAASYGNSSTFAADDAALAVYEHPLVDDSTLAALARGKK